MASTAASASSSASASGVRPALYVAEHAAPSGPGDARPTALQIVRDEGLLGNNALAGRVALVTGCSSGIGVETARAIHATGADTYITARDMAAAQRVVDDIRRSNPDSAGKLEVISMELGQLASVRAGAADFLRRSGGRLNLLVANAGVMATPYGRTVDGVEQQFGVCHVAHFLLFQLLKPALLSSASADYPSRVVALSSVGHHFGSVRLHDYNFEEEGSYQPWVGYGQAKTANIWFALEVERRYGARQLHATAVMPGGIWTPLQRHLDQQQLAQWKSDEKVARRIKSPQQGAATTVWAAVGAEWAHKGGKYLEDCAEAAPAQPASQPLEKGGFAPHAYDQEGAKQLWQLSCKLTNTSDSDSKQQ